MPPLELSASSKDSSFQNQQSSMMYPEQQFSQEQQLNIERQQPSNHLQQLSNQPQQLSNQPQQLSNQPQQLSTQPQQLSNQPQQLSHQPQQLSHQLQQLSNRQPHQLSNQQLQQLSPPFQQQKQFQQSLELHQSLELQQNQQLPEFQQRKLDHQQHKQQKSQQEQQQQYLEQQKQVLQQHDQIAFQQAHFQQQLSPQQISHQLNHDQFMQRLQHQQRSMLQQQQMQQQLQQQQLLQASMSSQSWVPQAGMWPQSYMNMPRMNPTLEKQNFFPRSHPSGSPFGLMSSEYPRDFPPSMLINDPVNNIRGQRMRGAEAPSFLSPHSKVSDNAHMYLDSKGKETDHRNTRYIDMDMPQCQFSQNRDQPASHSMSDNYLNNYYPKSFEPSQSNGETGQGNPVSYPHSNSMTDTKAGEINIVKSASETMVSSSKSPQFFRPGFPVMDCNRNESEMPVRSLQSQLKPEPKLDEIEASCGVHYSNSALRSSRTGTSNKRNSKMNSTSMCDLQAVPSSHRAETFDESMVRNYTYNIIQQINVSGSNANSAEGINPQRDGDNIHLGNMHARSHVSVSNSYDSNVADSVLGKRSASSCDDNDRRENIVRGEPWTPLNDRRDAISMMAGIHGEQQQHDRVGQSTGKGEYSQMECDSRIGNQTVCSTRENVMYSGEPEGFAGPTISEMQAAASQARYAAADISKIAASTTERTVPYKWKSHLLSQQLQEAETVETLSNSDCIDGLRTQASSAILSSNNMSTSSFGSADVNTLNNTTCDRSKNTDEKKTAEDSVLRKNSETEIFVAAEKAEIKSGENLYLKDKVNADSNTSRIVCGDEKPYSASNFSLAASSAASTTASTTAVPIVGFATHRMPVVAPLLSRNIRSRSQCSYNPASVTSTSNSVNSNAASDATAASKDKS